MPGATRLHHLARGVFLRALAAGSTVVLTTPSSAALPTGYAHVSPMPGARYVSPHNNVVVRGTSYLDRGVLDPGTVTVVGSSSGVHRGALTLAEDGQTLIFLPNESFHLGERVTVTLASGLRTMSGERLPPLAFDFAVGAVDPRLQGRRRRQIEPEDARTRHRLETAANITPVAAAIDTLPASYPPIIVTRSNNPESGHLFMTPNPPGSPVPGNLVIMDNLGQPLFYRRMPNRTTDFNKHSNGQLSFFHDETYRYYLLDATYTVVDSFETGNGYMTDNHELELMPNGHALMMAYDSQPVRMDSVIAGGDSNAVVTGLIVQEVDAAKNVVFQWRSWDHMNILDMNSCTENILSADIDYVHGNSIDLDTDGNLLISSRHLNEVTKIDRQTGAIIWRFGRNALRNQFTILNDPRGFSHQHDARRLPNGRLSIFDNGNCLDTLYSRALEYQLDEVNKVATLVWQYRDTPDTYGRATGSLQRRAGGGTLIDWGFGLKVTDLHPDDSKSFEVLFSVLNMQTYRAYRYPWTTTQFSLDSELLDFGSVAIGDSATLELTVRNDWNRAIEIDRFVSTEARFRVLDPVPLAVPVGGSATVDVVFKPEATGPVHGMLYARAVNDTELVAQRVELRGAGPTSSVADREDALAFAIHPSPSGGRTHVAFTLPREDHVHVRVLDVQGRVVHVLADGRYPAGRHEVVWDASRMAPGVYFASFEGGGRTMMRRTVVIH